MSKIDPTKAPSNDTHWGFTLFIAILCFLVGSIVALACYSVMYSLKKAETEVSIIEIQDVKRSLSSERRRSSSGTEEELNPYQSHPQKKFGYAEEDKEMREILDNLISLVPNISEICSDSSEEESSPEIALGHGMKSNIPQKSIKNIEEKVHHHQEAMSSQDSVNILLPKQVIPESSLGSNKSQSKTPTLSFINSDTKAKSFIESNKSKSNSTNFTDDTSVERSRSPEPILEVLSNVEKKLQLWKEDESKDRPIEEDITHDMNFLEDIIEMLSEDSKNSEWKREDVVFAGGLDDEQEFGELSDEELFHLVENKLMKNFE